MSRVTPPLEPGDSDDVDGKFRVPPLFALLAVALVVLVAFAWLLVTLIQHLR
jgi:hypothetical protein